MRSLKLALLASVAVAGITSAAAAADLIIDPAPAPVIDNYGSVDWSGPYAGRWVSGQTDSIFGLGAGEFDRMIDRDLRGQCTGEHKGGEQEKGGFHRVWKQQRVSPVITGTTFADR